MFYEEDDDVAIEENVDLSPPDNRDEAINKPKRGRRAPTERLQSSLARERGNSYRHSDNKMPHKVNNKPQRELESVMHDASPPLKTMPDGSGRFVGFNLPQYIIDRFRKQGFLLYFLSYGPTLGDYTSVGFRPVMISEVPEIALAHIPIPGLYKEELREYFIYREYMLTKISLDDYDVYKRDWESRMVNNEKVAVEASSVRPGKRKQGMVYGRDRDTVVM